jgi:hypothetical protein
MKRLMTLALTLAASACAVNPPPVVVVGPAPEIAALAGEWIGEYHSVETGRSGSITFKLEAGKDTAYGDVLMVPREANPITPESRFPSESMRTAPQVLTIAFVRVSGGMVSGEIQPYRSPDCGCLLSTVFRGEIRGDRIEGDFVIRHSDHNMAPQKGTWFANRAPRVSSP